MMMLSLQRVLIAFALIYNSSFQQGLAQAQSSNATGNGTTSSATTTTVFPTVSPALVSTIPTLSSSVSPTVSERPTTTSATTAATANACSQLQAGDLQIILLNAEEPVQIVWYTLAEIPSAVEFIYATTNAWDGSKFVGPGKDIKFAVPQNTSLDSDGEPCSGLCSRAVLSFGFPYEEGMLQFASDQSNMTFEGNNGGTIFTYCNDANNDPHFLHGLTFTENGWLSSLDSSITTNMTGESVLPTSLETQGSVELPPYDTFLYIGPIDENKTDLVTMYFTDPSNYTWNSTGRYTYSQASALTATTKLENECSSLPPGSLQIVMLNSEDPDQIIWFALTLIPKEVGYLYVTDDAWNGTGFLRTEGTIKIKVPDFSTDSKGNGCPGICPAGSLSYGFPADKDKWENLDSSFFFDLSVMGDTVLTYCMDAYNKPHFLHGFSYATNGWADDGLSNYTPYEQSALPEDLKTQGSVELLPPPYFPNWVYKGSTDATTEELITQYFNNPSYYSGTTTRNEYGDLNTDTSAAPWRWCFANTLLLIGSTVIAMMQVI